MSAGYSFDEDALRVVAEVLSDAGSELKEAGTAEVIAPDVGISSEVVADTIGQLLASSALAAELLGNVAGKVDAADGSYAYVELANTFMVRDDGN